MKTTPPGKFWHFLFLSYALWYIGLYFYGKAVFLAKLLMFLSSLKTSFLIRLFPDRQARASRVSRRPLELLVDDEFARENGMCVLRNIDTIFERENDRDMPCSRCALGLRLARASTIWSRGVFLPLMSFYAAVAASLIR